MKAEIVEDCVAHVLRRIVARHLRRNGSHEVQKLDIKNYIEDSKILISYIGGTKGSREA